MSTAEENTTKDLKPTHRSRFARFSPSMGWKAFWSEIFIVILGVLIALAANEAVEDWNWQRKVAVAETKLQQEAESNFTFAAEQVSAAPCIIAQINALQQRLLSSGNVLDPAPAFTDDFVTYTFRIPSRPYISSVWQAVNADGTASHINDLRQYLYARLYTQLADMVERTQRTNVLFARSSMLANPIPLDPATRSMLLGELLEQRGHTRLNSIVASQMMGYMRDLGQQPSTKIVQDFLTKESGTMAFCKAQGLPVADWQKVLDKEPVELVNSP